MPTPRWCWMVPILLAVLPGANTASAEASPLIIVDASALEAPAVEEAARLLTLLSRQREADDAIVIMSGVPAPWLSAEALPVAAEFIDVIVIPEALGALAGDALKELGSIDGMPPMVGANSTSPGNHLASAGGHHILAVSAAITAESLREALNGLATGASTVLFVDGPAVSIMPALRASGDALELVITTDQVPPGLAGHDPPVLSSVTDAGRVRRVTIDGPRDGVAFADLDAGETTPDERILSRLRNERTESASDRDVPAGARTDPLERLPEDGPASLFLTGSNRTMRVEVLGIERVDQYGDLAPRPGFMFLRVETRWINRMAPDLYIVHGVGEGIGIADIRRQVFLVLNGRVLSAIPAKAERQVGHLPASIRLLHAEDDARGDLLFELPDEPVDGLVLGYYPLGFGAVRIPIVGADDAETKVDVEELGNEFLELAVLDVREQSEVAGHTAREGTAYLIIDMRGRSRFTRPGIAAAVDPGSAIGEMTDIPRVFDYLKSERMLLAFIDGEWPLTPRWELSSMPPDPPLLPDQFAGGDVVYEVPADVETIELRANFPEFKLTTGESLGTPEPLHFPVRGEAPEMPAAVADVVFQDEPIAVGIMSVGAKSSLAGASAPDGQHFILVDLVLKHGGDEGGDYRLLNRISLDLGDRALKPRQIVGPADIAIPDPLWIGPETRRRVRVVFAVPNDVTTASLTYSGVTQFFGTELDLPLASGEVAAADALANMPSEPRAADEPEPEVAMAPAETDETDAPDIATPPLIPKGLPGVGLTAKQVNDAIDRGREFLWNHLQEEGGLHGRNRRETAVAVLALVHAEALERIPEFESQLRRFLDEFDPSSRSYQLGVMCMLIDAYGDPAYFPKLEMYARRLINGQHADGTWNYSASKEPRELDQEADGPLTVLGGHPPADKAEPVELDRTIPEREKPASGDNSIAQFVVLGLRAAERRGFGVPERVWKRIRERYLERQNEDGGWAYRDRGRSYGSMTCAGICSTLITGHSLGVEDPGDHSAIDRGLAWIDEHFTVSTNPNKSSHHYYYLYSLERTGRLLDTEFLGTHEWYPLGARQLVRSQQADGSWVGKREEKEPRLATGYALLFLTRATEKLEIEEASGGPGTLITEAVRREPKAIYVILDASGSMRAPTGSGSRFDLALDAMRELAAAVPAETPVALRVYGHRRTALDDDANEDSELLMPLGPLDRSTLEPILSRLRPRGKTPLAYSLEQAGRDLRRESDGARIVLLTDGGEDPDSGRDPVAAVRALGGDHELHIVGLAIDRPEWNRQLRTMASAANGRYWPVDEAGDLGTVLESVALDKPGDFVLRDASGEVIARGSFGQSFELPEGEYALAANWAGVPLEDSFWVRSDQRTRVVFRPELVDAARAPAVATPVRMDEPDAAEEPAEAPSAVKFCPNCGTRVTPGAKFCGSCGTKLPG